ncbi:BTB And Kelch [Cooperia oncophora]
MFTNDTAEIRMQEVEMVGVEATALVALVDFCYSGKIKIRDIDVQSILTAACLLQMKEVQALCCKLLEETLKLTNCLKIRAMAEAHACGGLLRRANKYILRNFRHIVGTEKFHQLSVDELIEFISSDELYVRAEEQVFDAVIQWIRFDLPARKELLSKVKLIACWLIIFGTLCFH